MPEALFPKGDKRIMNSSLFQNFAIQGKIYTASSPSSPVLILITLSIG
jgi:hypothetical protein